MKPQEKELIKWIKNCPEITETIDACKVYGLKNYYLAGGAITQLIWNNLSGKPNLAKVKDFDIVYFDENTNEKRHKKHLAKLLTHGIELDIVNQAYVHEWYHLKSGNRIGQYKNTEEGMKTWLPAFAIGIRKSSKIEIYAPYGLEDAFSMKVKPNKRTMSKANYSEMTQSFKKRWKEIEVIPWD
ncbi:MAG TPA: hypothetical protein ENJ82_02950 [Bacteroidetes bacterium]|nr:hypothetical protein [Bacteroidota bacterium]